LSAASPALGRTHTAANGEARLAVAVVAVAIALLPITIPEGPVGIAPVDAVVLLALCATLVWAGASAAPLHAPYVVPVAILVLSGAVAALLGPFPGMAGVAVVQDIVLFAWCLAIANVARTPEAIRTLLRAWTWSAIAWSTFLVVAVGLGISSEIGVSTRAGRALLTFDTPNSAGNYFLVSLFVVLAADRPRTRLGRVAAYVIVTLALGLTGSMAALLGLIGGVVVGGAVAIARRRGIASAVALLAVVALASVVAIGIARRDNLLQDASHSPYSLIRNSIGRVQRSSTPRLGRLSELWQLRASAPTLGWGPATTKLVLKSERVLFAKEAHNDYVAAFVERGVGGGVGIVLLLGAVWVRGSVSARRQLRLPFADALRSPVPLVSALVAIAISGMFHEILHFRQVWTLLGIVAALHLWAVDRSPLVRSSITGGSTA